ncbi:phosphogluconate dehydrogenase (NADP(+)-dependent, decarboxylating) [Vagococcus martis]|uniref:6-phosphogluconate dehydrogenase, decarboxylating n=1 Tax=Vagococcus martis TaxID=1768210 RepID=A0A1V4DFT0_9ENTE|nr:NADP-dependent phosphogluconate dehydrogenase [Vagococcus martis]OPF87313.1 phosphogluconate dehydrogenase (NADP(+)-dependent, decarboxylating) [Vagococcus martis]
MSKQQFGMVGLGVMGKNLALNSEGKGYSVSVYSHFYHETDEFLKNHPEKNIKGFETIDSFVESIETPRKIMLMVTAGKITDTMIEQLVPYLDKDDVLIDGGNTHYTDTLRRSHYLKEFGINFVGSGVSGGEEGALNGPSLMPGGQREAYDLINPLFEDIAAKAHDGKPCVSYIGPDGAGHFVKMVHNGIEYGDMQLIAESYDILTRGLHLSIEEVSDIFSMWNDGELNSYLMTITSELLMKKDDLDTQDYIVTHILDKAGNKGTGKWTSQHALDLGVPLPLVTEAVFARFMSALKEERCEASRILPGPNATIKNIDKNVMIEKVRRALYFSKIMSYAQGFSQMMMASNEYNWSLNYGEIAQIFREGCIIRAQFLQKITDAYEKNPTLKNLMLDDYFLSIVSEYQSDIREVVSLAVKLGVPVPSLSSAISYYDSYRSKDLPANIIQAQRDYFGAHTYERKDRDGIFHYDWYKKDE